MLVREAVKNAAVGVGVADTPEGLSAIHRPGCAAVMWRRQLRPEFQSWASRLDPTHLPQGRVILHRDAVLDIVHQLCEMAETPLDPEREWLVEDVAALSRRFADLMGVQYLRLRLDAVTTNACRKFHIDAVSARLVCTYRGAGTQYGISTDGEEPQRVFSVPNGAPILLRGTLWPESPKSGLLHRSPPIEGTGETRLVLVADPISDPVNKPEHEILH